MEKLFTFSLWFIHVSNTTNSSISANTTGCIINPPPDPHPYKLETHVYAWMASGIAAIASIVITLFLMIKHLRNFHDPVIQKHIIRILLMVPIYSIDSWISFRYYVDGVYIDMVR
jgi:hypothetical protein